MNIMELSSVEKDEKKTLEWIGNLNADRIHKSRWKSCTSHEKIIRQDYVKRKIVETSARRLRRIEKQVEEESGDGEGVHV